ncbi:MAG: hypothetical protein WAV09_01245 [Minisyncoccia bacterium]
MAEQEFWPYGGNEYADDAALVLNALAKRCIACERVTRNEFLQDDDKCPVCRGTASQVRGLRDFGTNGGVRCDVSSGPCSCGAFH